MKRISLVFAMIVLLVGIPVQAQKKNRPSIQPLPIDVRPAPVLIQSDTGEGYMTFDMKSGAFQCHLCEYNYSLKGTGSVKIDGVNIYFSSISDNYSVFASVNLYAREAKCVIEVFNLPSPSSDVVPLTEYLVDSDLLNSKAECAPVSDK